MAIEDIGFNQAELRILALLGDEKGHAQWEICDKLKIDKAYTSKTLKGLKNRGLIFSEERSLIRPRKERGPHTEYPYYIQKDQLPIITKTILQKIKHYLSKYQSTASERELLRAEGTLTPTPEGELPRSLVYWGAAEAIMGIFRDTLYRDCLSEIYKIDHITYDAACDLIYSESGIIWTTHRIWTDRGEPPKMSRVEAFQTLVSNIEHEKEVEAERRTLECDPVAIQTIKEMWNKGEITNIYKYLGYSHDATIAHINQMLDCGEIS